MGEVIGKWLTIALLTLFMIVVALCYTFALSLVTSFLFQAAWQNMVPNFWKDAPMLEFWDIFLCWWAIYFLKASVGIKVETGE